MTTMKTSARPSRNGASFDISFPKDDATLSQDEEWYEFTHEGERRRLRIHDYAEMFDVPGLYEALVYDTLRCSSPRRLARLLNAVLVDRPTDPIDLRVLDLGAGNGAMAEELRHEHVGHIVGLDLLPEAASAAQRDRPEVYEEYFVADLCDLDDDERRRIEGHRLNCLVTVAALGFGDIPPEAFATAFNLIAEDGWLAMTIKDDFLSSADPSGFARLLRAMIDVRIIDVQGHLRYRHRLSVSGEPLYYIALVARKHRDVPLELAEAAAAGSVQTARGRAGAMVLGA